MYVELHSHSAYSFLDGASLPEEIVAAASKFGYGAFALTDHNSVAGSMEFAEAAKAVGLKAIHGAEVDVSVSLSAHSPTSSSNSPPLPDSVGLRSTPTGNHLTLLVKNEVGWSNLCRIITAAHRDSRLTPSVSLETVCSHAAGLVCLTGCFQRGVTDSVVLGDLLDAFGRECLRVEIQQPYLRGGRAVIKQQIQLAEKFDLKYVATGNVHAHSRQRAPLQDVFVAIRNGTTLDASESLRRGNWSHVLAKPEAMAARFADFGRHF